jgi:carboxypeptidase PM20D1
MRRVVLLLLASLLLLGAVVVTRTFLLRSPAVAFTPAPPRAFDEARVAAVLGAAIRAATISPQSGEHAGPAFAELSALLTASFPRTFTTLAVETIDEASLLLRWQGADPALPPLLLLAHQDVVPVADAEKWAQAPFSGAIVDGFVWGRGALDDKGPLVAMLTAVEALLAEAWVPQRDVLFAFGHDEELGGRGAQAMATLLAARGVRPALILDEGLAVLDGVAPGVQRPVGVVGVAEKGYLSLELVARAEGGHSSMPDREPAIAILARAVSRASAPLPARFDGPGFAMLRALAPELSFSTRMAIANRELFSPLLERQLADNPVTDASLRTTVAPTMIAGGIKDNVVAPVATAVLNFRLFPGDTRAWVLAETERRIADRRVTVRPFDDFGSEASSVSPAGGWGFEVVARSLRETLPDVLVAPGLVLGATDARHYAQLSDQVLRFAAFRLRPEDLARVHGRDERIPIADLAWAVRFYARLIENASR